MFQKSNNDEERIMKEKILAVYVLGYLAISFIAYLLEDEMEKIRSRPSRNFLTAGKPPKRTAGASVLNT